jgi:hypothetical protein
VSTRERERPNQSETSGAAIRNKVEKRIEKTTPQHAPHIIVYPVTRSAKI